MRHLAMTTTVLAATLCADIAFASSEWVTVEKVLDGGDKGIVSRRNGEQHLIEKGTGCIAFYRYEGRKVLVVSPGLFLGVGSSLLIPDEDKKCRIWNSEEIGNGNPITQPSRPSAQPQVAAKIDVRAIQAALKILGFYAGPLDGKPASDNVVGVLVVTRARRPDGRPFYGGTFVEGGRDDATVSLLSAVNRQEAARDILKEW